ncbi:helix-turn-helix transcriptional regulator [Allofournierella sp.]|uniref:helix-turn-helix transcriptional regulator n=1 Tax=Allofournierella sp. TaxID=1940256 RepID=UPI003AB3B837
MPMNTVIREKRKALGLTQEEVADALGVTAPAVNKWEKGATAPDISLLPPLARLLGVDLNDLFCFFEGPSQPEIDRFNARLGQVLRSEGVDAAFALALAETRKYPNCAPLLHAVATALDGALLLSATAAQKQQYEGRVIALYEQAVRCGAGALQGRSRFLLAGKYLAQGRLDEAQELLDLLPEPEQPDKRQLQAQLLLAQGRTADAAKLYERKLIAATGEVQAALLNLLDIALDEGRSGDASALADVSHRLAGLMGQAEFSALLPQLEFAVKRQNEAASLDLLKRLFASLPSLSRPPAGPLYHHLAPEYQARAQTLAPEQVLSTLLPGLLAELETAPRYAFLQKNEEFRQLLARWRRA